MPRDIVSKTFQHHLIDNEQAWLLMLSGRNRTSHIYQEEIALQVSKNIKEYFPVMKTNYESIRAKYFNQGYLIKI